MAMDYDWQTSSPDRYDILKGFARENRNSAFDANILSETTS